MRGADVVAVGTGAVSNARAVADGWAREAADGLEGGAPAGSSRPSARRPALFSDEVLARMPVRRVPRRKG